MDTGHGRGLLAGLMMAGVSVAVAQTSDPATVSGTVEWFFEALPQQAPPDAGSAAGQRYTQAIPAAGRDDLWTAIPDRLGAPRSCDSIPQPEGGIARHLVELAGQTRIVIVNEAHDSPRHRRLTESLLPALWERGYRYFAAEAFSDGVDDFPSEPYGRADAGLYASEPTFGDLIRTAKRSGFSLVAYEASPRPGIESASLAEQVAYREEAQAENLVASIFSRDDRARVVVHVGYSHAAEVPISSFGGTTMPWMAARLKEKTGIDPLTIDQTYCLSVSGRVELSSQTSQMPAGTFDVSIAYPDVETIQGRARWRISPDRRLVPLPAELIPTEGRAIVEARRLGEPDLAVPVDRLLLRAGESLPLVLPAGEFRLTAFDEAGTEPLVLQIAVD